MTAFYNEIDPNAAAWLRNLIAAGHIADGVVDERSIEDITPEELHAFTQCHFFAGIGGWSLALRLAGWGDDRPVWTGSCPCQPFSAAGKGVGFADERHLWPAFHHLIATHTEWCRRQKRCPPKLFGEQVASKDADPWIDLVCADLEALGYAFGAVPFPSAGIGAPHIRDRLYWVADAADQRLHGRGPGEAGHGRYAARGEPKRLRNAGGLADTNDARLEGRRAVRQRAAQCLAGSSSVAGDRPLAGGVRDVHQHGDHLPTLPGHLSGSALPEPAPPQSQPTAGPVNGQWAAADWLLCRDGKWRPVEPGTFPLAHGAAARVGRLRAYGNAINAVAAQEFIEAYEASRRQRFDLSALQLVEDLV